MMLLHCTLVINLPSNVDTILHVLKRYSTAEQNPQTNLAITFQLSVDFYFLI